LVVKYQIINYVDKCIIEWYNIANKAIVISKGISEINERYCNHRKKQLYEEEL